MPAEAYGMPTPNETMTFAMPVMPAVPKTLTLSMPAEAYGMRAPNETTLWRSLQLPAAHRSPTLSMPASAYRMPAANEIHVLAMLTHACSTQKPHTVDACHCQQDACT